MKRRLAIYLDSIVRVEEVINVETGDVLKDRVTIYYESGESNIVLGTFDEIDAVLDGTNERKIGFYGDTKKNTKGEV